MGEFTYEHLFDVLRRERSREELQQLDAGFYDLAKSYLETQAEKARGQDPFTAHGEQWRTQLQNARKLLRELYDRREKKIMLLALNKARTNSSIIDTASLLDAERRLFEDAVGVLLDYREKLHPVQEGPVPVAKPRPAPAAPQKVSAAPPKPAPTPTPTEATDAAVRIVQAVPKFLGANKETYGPYSPGEEVSLPDNIARILIKKGRAEQA